MSDPVNEQELQQARLNHAAGVLNSWLTNFVQSRSGRIGDNDFEEIVEAVKMHTRECRNQGVPFPDMMVIMLRKAGHIALGRKDWTREEVESFILKMANGMPEKLDVQELADAVSEAWPEYAADLTFGRTRH